MPAGYKEESVTTMLKGPYRDANEIENVGKHVENAACDRDGDHVGRHAQRSLRDDRDRIANRPTDTQRAATSGHMPASGADPRDRKKEESDRHARRQRSADTR